MGTDPKRPFAGNPLLTRADVVTAAHSLVTPLFGSLLPSGARVDLPRVGSQSDDVVGLEALARVLWALVPLAACGSGAEHWPRVRDGITAGTDPAHTDYWGAARAGDQRLVEMAAIGVALRYAPELIWDALTGVQRDRLAAWLAGIDACELYPNNWLFFRVLVDLGRARVGLPYDVAALAFALDGIDARACDNGWYDDSPPDSAPVHDWYTPFAYHVYGLLGARAGADEVIGRARTDRYRERAASFARQLSAWFAPDGSALAYGRSTTYRFAQAAFWGMLAAADVDALPWGEVRGLYLRNLRAWAAVPVADDRGRLTVGYGYPHSAFGESYISAGSPYWSAKAFLALLAPEAHPFWDAPERALPSGGVSVQARPGMVLTRDAHQVLAVTHGQPGPRYLPDRAARYARIAYSSYFGFCLDRSRGDDPDAPTAMSDSTIALVDHRGTRRVRRDPDRLEVVGDLVAGRWCPWPDVVVETVAWGRAPWHARAHVITSGQSLVVEEWGFAVGLEAGAAPDASLRPGSVVIRSPFGVSGLLDATGERTASVHVAGPGGNIVHPHTAVPRLSCRLGPGRHVLTSLVLGTAAGDDRWDDPPQFPPEVVALALARGAPRRQVVRAAALRWGQRVRQAIRPVARLG